MNAKNNILSIDNLDFYYGDFKALDKINMNIESNSVTAFIGPSGCGKSTLLRTINRMNELIDNTRLDGKIKFDNKNAYLDYEVIELRKRIGMVFQKPNPFPMSIYDNIVYGIKLHYKKSKNELDEIVERSLRGAALWDEVKDRLKKNALELSGGQQQRLCIARAIAIEPEVILMDEPTSALDPIATAKIEELIIRLKEKYTIVIVTHSMHQAARISDYTGFFLTGKLIEFDKTENLFSNPKNNKTEDYITGRFG